jgi:hypothetical protein
VPIRKPDVAFTALSSTRATLQGMKAEPKASLFYLDDGYPESREYDDNYVVIGSSELRELLRTRMALPLPSPRGGTKTQGMALADASR